MKDFAAASVNRPLTGIRVIDVVDGPLQTVGRILSDLGAEVIRVEPPGGATARRSGVMFKDVSLTFEVRNAGKQSLVVDTDTDAGRQEFLDLAQGASVVIRDGSVRKWAQKGLDAETLRIFNERLVVMELSDFGSFGDRASWTGTADVHAALSTVLSRSGLPEMVEPLLPPEFLMYESAAVQAVWSVMLELANVRATGNGDVADFSVQEALIQILDPAFGIGGSARVGVPLRDLPRGRPDARHLYPIFRAANGWVRICVLSKRQWQGMFEWLDRPADFADPKYDSTNARFAAAPQLYPLIGQLFEKLTMEEAVEQGQKLGVPTAALAGPREVLAEDAFRENGSFLETSIAGHPAAVHSGWYEIDGVRVPAQGPGPRLGQATPSSLVTGLVPLPGARPGKLPFEGLRVLDLGVIVVGSELGRLFADYGADVIKVESSSFPDGSRQSPNGEPITEGASWGMRNKRSLGLNLRSDEGKQIFAELVKVSDVILTNFKPGTLASLGFDMETLRRLNPGVILSESSAFGNHGSWSRRLGYGPLVRASAGLSSLWSYPDEQDGFSDAITIFPDHVVARLNAAAIVALLVRRDRTGSGGQVSTAQVDAIFGGLADALLAESLAPGSGGLQTAGNDRPYDAFRGVFPAKGDDEWIVIDADTDERFRAAAITIGRPDLARDPAFSTPARRWARRNELRHLLAQWTQTRNPHSAAAFLQAAGVPAGAMLRADDLQTDPHLRGRGVFGELIQPQLDEPLITNLGETRSQALPDPLLTPAPLMAEHTREVLIDTLGLDDGEVDRLLGQGALEENPAARSLPVA